MSFYLISTVMIHCVQTHVCPCAANALAECFPECDLQKLDLNFYQRIILLMD